MESLRTQVLQIRFGRLYLSQGTEALILPGCHVTLVCGDDSLQSCRIEQSYYGVAITEPIPGIDSLTISDDCIAIVLPAQIDTVGQILIGTDIPPGSPLENILINSDTGLISQPVYYANRTAMLIDYEQGTLDGYLSYRSAHSGTTENHVVSISAPYIAALAPHPAREFNQGGAITTSLYYRFDHNNISSLFEGDNLAATTSFFNPAATHRPYSFDHKKGERLFRSERNRPSSLRVFVQDRSLESLRVFYADILSRDRCRVSIVNDRTEADISFLWQLSPASGELLMESFHLSQDTAKNNRLNESIRLLRNLLTSASSESSETRRAFLLEKADHVLANDIGYFALFRPTLFLTTSKQIVGKPFENDGQISFSRLGRLILPAADIGSEQ